MRGREWNAAFVWLPYARQSRFCGERIVPARRITPSDYLYYTINRPACQYDSLKNTEIAMYINRRRYKPIQAVHIVQNTTMHCLSYHILSPQSVPRLVEIRELSGEGEERVQ